MSDSVTEPQWQSYCCSQGEREIGSSGEERIGVLSPLPKINTEFRPGYECRFLAALHSTLPSCQRNLHVLHLIAFICKHSKAP